MLSVRGTVHQGHQKFGGAGRQCTTNSYYAMITSKTKNPKTWTTHDLDNVLEIGDGIFQNLTVHTDHLLISDLPKEFENFQMKVLKSFSGTIDRNKTEGPFTCLIDAMNEVQEFGFVTLECYTTAVILDDGIFYVFDPHSRTAEGMPCPDGCAVLTKHANVEDLCLFFRELCSCLFKDKQSPMFEVTNVVIDNVCDSSTSDFDGFSEISENEQIKLYTAERILNPENVFSDSSESSDNVPLSFYRQTHIDSSVSDETCESDNVPLSFYGYKKKKVAAPNEEGLDSYSDITPISSGSEYKPESESNLSSSDSMYVPIKKKKKLTKNRFYTQGIDGEFSVESDKKFAKVPKKSRRRLSAGMESRKRQSDGVKSRKWQSADVENGDGYSRERQSAGIGIRERQSAGAESSKGESVCVENGDGCCKERQSVGVDECSRERQSAGVDSRERQSAGVESRESQSVESRKGEGACVENDDGDGCGNGERQSAGVESRDRQSDDAESRERQSAGVESREGQSAGVGSSERQCAGVESRKGQSACVENDDGDGCSNGERQSAGVESRERQSADVESRERQSAGVESREGQSADVESREGRSAGVESSERQCAGVESRKGQSACVDDGDGCSGERQSSGVENRERQGAGVERRGGQRADVESIGSADVENDGDSRQVKRGRKRQRDVSRWRRVVRKRRKDSGKSYVTENGKACRARLMGTGCGAKCRFKCNENFTESQRHDLFQSYWSLADITLQRQFLLKHAQSNETRCKTTDNNKRSKSIKWFMPNKNEIVRVCKIFFLETLDISGQMVQTAMQKSTSIGMCSPEGRGKHTNRPIKIPEDQKEFVREHISSFPSVESHYCRKDSRRQYLSTELNLTKMYRLYLEKCNEKNCSPVKLCTYRNIFDTEFNLGFHKPIKDLCDLCSAYRQADAILKRSLSLKYEQHIKDKDAARNHKTHDKENAKYGEKDFAAACFDLQEVLVTPKSFESILYYKRRLNTFNFTVYDLGSSDGYCYIWNETISKRGASEISSSVLDYIGIMSKKGKTKFVFYSDNCGGQNKNRFYLTMLWYCLRKFNLNYIEHKFLEKGHTQNEGDSMHACIESSSRNISVYTTGQWAAIVRSARSSRPYIVKEMSQKNFFDFQKVSRYLKNFDLDFNRNKIRFSEIKTFRICADSPDTVYFRYHYNDEELSFNLSQRLRHSEVHDPKDIELSQLNSSLIEMSKEKYRDLVSLCRNGVIPYVYHPHYLLLPHQIM